MKKFKNIIFIIIFILISICIVVFNYKMDPYNFEKYTKKNEFIDLFEAPRDLIYTILNKSKNDKYEIVYVSGSSGHSTLPFDFFISNTGKSIAKLSFAGVSSKEEYELLKRFLELHPETKKAVISLEFRTYLRCYPPNSVLEEGKNLSKLKTFLKLYYSFDAIKNSIIRFPIKIKESKPLKKEEIRVFNNNDDNRFYMANYWVKYSCFDGCRDKNLVYLKKIKDLLKEKQVEGIFFTPPAHSILLGEYNEYGELEYIENLKRLYAQITPFYDMVFANHYTTVPWQGNFIFRDSCHLSPIQPHFAELELINIIINGKHNEEITNYITKENVEEVLEKQRIPLMKYIEENKKEIENYTNFDYKYEKVASYEEKIYHKDVSESYREKYYNF